MACRSFFQVNEAPEILAVREEGGQASTAAVFYTDAPLQLAIGGGGNASDSEDGAATTVESQPLEDLPSSIENPTEDPIFVAIQQVCVPCMHR